MTAPVQLSVFDFQDQPVRILDQNGSPWFAASDICRVLELGNPTESLRPLDSDEKITLSNSEGNPRGGIPHQMAYVSESGLYALIFKSRKPQAKAFRKWVTAEVLPALRQTGHYEMPSETLALPDSAPTGLDALHNPTTVPRFAAREAAQLNWGIRELIRFGNLCRLLAKALGIPYVLTSDWQYGQLRAFPAAVCYQAMREVSATLPDRMTRGDEVEALLKAFASLLAETGSFGTEDLISFGHSQGICRDIAANNDGKKSLGRRLRAFRGRLLTTGSGRKFILQIHRGKRGISYVFEFQPPA